MIKIPNETPRSYQRQAAMRVSRARNYLASARACDLLYCLHRSAVIGLYQSLMRCVGLTTYSITVP